jgi:hypothetical protein
MNDAGVDARHNEGSKPGVEIAVVLRPVEALLTRFRLMIRWAQQIGVLQRPSKGRIFRGFRGSVDDACNGSSGYAAADGFDAHLDMGAVTTEPLECSLLQEMDSEI